MLSKVACSSKEQEADSDRFYHSILQRNESYSIIYNSILYKSFQLAKVAVTLTTLCSIGSKMKPTYL